MRSTSHSPSRQLAASSRSSSRSPSRTNNAGGGVLGTAFLKSQLRPSLCQSVYNISHQSGTGIGHDNNRTAALGGHYIPGGCGVGPLKRSAGAPPWSGKPRVLSRLAQKSRIHELAREVLPKFDLSFLTSHHHQHPAGPALDEDRMDDDGLTTMMNIDQDAEFGRPHGVTKSRSMTRLAAAAAAASSSSSRNASPTKGFVGGGYYASSSSSRTPTAQRKRGGSRDSGLGSTATASPSPTICSRSPQSSPLLLHRDKRSGGAGGGSCKDQVDFEESLALALALSKSLYHESPLPLIPGLSAQKLHLSAHDVLAHPHRDVSFHPMGDVSLHSSCRCKFHPVREVSF
jgi:hypothetical protein